MIRRPMKTRTVLVGLIVGVVALALLATVALLRQVLVTEAAIQVNRALEQEGQELTEFVRSQPIETDERLEDYARRVLLEFVETNVPETNEAFYAVQEGKVIASTPNAPDGVEGVIASLQSSNRSSLTDGTSDRGTVRALGQPIVEQGEQAGLLAVMFFTDERAALINATVRDAVAISAVTLLLTLLAAWLIAGRVVAPLALLADTAQDITEHDLSRRIPEQGTLEMAALISSFNSMVDRLEHVVDDQQQFLNDASHELRTPLTVMQGHLELAERDPSHTDRTKRIVTGEIERMSRIVDDLLILARSEGSDFLHRSPIDIDDFLRGILELVEDIGPQRWSLDSVPVGIIEADGTRLTQAMLNLAVNADRHTPDDQLVHLGGTLTNHELHLWVRDPGEGIDPADHDRIFQRRIRGSSRESGGSAGLGLTIVDTIARAHGGTVKIDSALGAGATFTIVLPLETET